MKTKAIVHIETYNTPVLTYEKIQTYNEIKDVQVSSKLNELYEFKRIRDAKAFFDDRISSFEKVLKDSETAFDKWESKDDEKKPTYHEIEYEYSIGGREHTVTFSFNKEV